MLQLFVDKNHSILIVLRTFENTIEAGAFHNSCFIYILDIVYEKLQSRRNPVIMFFNYIFDIIETQQRVLNNLYNFTKHSPYPQMCYKEREIYKRNVKYGVSCYQAMTIYYHKCDVFYVIHVSWIINALSVASPSLHNYIVRYKPKRSVQSNIFN